MLVKRWSSGGLLFDAGRSNRSQDAAGGGGLLAAYVGCKAKLVGNKGGRASRILESTEVNGWI
jgi:hypothetical protein